MIICLGAWLKYSLPIPSPPKLWNNLPRLYPCFSNVLLVATFVTSGYSELVLIYLSFIHTTPQRIAGLWALPSKAHVSYPGPRSSVCTEIAVLLQMSCCSAAVLAEGIHFLDISPSLHSPLITAFLMFIHLFLVLLSGSSQFRKKGLLPMLLQAQVPTCFPCVPREILWPFELSLPCVLYFFTDSYL